MFHAEYSSGQPLRMLVDLHSIVDEALSSTSSAGTQTKSAAAGAGFGTGQSDTQEFNISGDPAPWNPEGSN
jgi:hypothetical protein